MNWFKRTLFLVSIVMIVSASACSSTPTAADAFTTDAEAPNSTESEAVAAEVIESTAADSSTSNIPDDAAVAALTFDNTAWNYDSDNDVYYQIGVQYSTRPETLDYETLGIYVPGAYLTATDNGNGTFTATVNNGGTLNGYTAQTAPMVFPVNTAGYSAQMAPTSYSYNGLSSYLEAGFIYVYSGMRGRENGYDDSGNLIYSGGAPWGVTDLKAAIRYLRFNKDILPGNTDSIFTFGHSGGGAQSTLMGATGNSELYFPYLESIGAAMYTANGEYISDAVTGVMAWCPITSLDYADEAYEWNMGQYSDIGTRAGGTWTSALSNDLATAFANYINNLGIKDENGNVLVLEETQEGIYTAGSYYDYVKATIEESLNNFLSDTTFPYTETSGGMMGDGGFGGGNAPSGDMPGGGTPPSGSPSGDMPSGGTPPSGAPSGEMPSGEMASGGTPGGDSTSTDSSGTTYETAQDYIDSLNADTEWVTYDSTTNTASITSVEDFVNCCKTASKSVPAFDALDRSQAENNVFGNDDSDSLHFDAIVAGLLTQNQETYATYSDWDASLVDAYTTDLQAVDKLGSSIETRLDMYNPMYYVSDYYDGYQTSTVAPHWRIHTGIEQGDTATTVEMNLALALGNYSGVKDVEFATVWNQGHTTAERTGDSTTNFIAWVNGILQNGQ